MKHILCLLGLHKYETRTIPIDNCTVNIVTSCKHCAKDYISSEVVKAHTWVPEGNPDAKSVTTDFCVVTYLITKCSVCEITDEKFIIELSDGTKYYMDYPAV